jgi:hypothetical protein
MCLQFGFVFFWQKDFGAKAAHKMLVKLTPGWAKMASPEGKLMALALSPHQKVNKAEELTYISTNFGNWFQLK